MEQVKDITEQVHFAQTITQQIGRQALYLMGGKDYQVLDSNDERMGGMQFSVPTRNKINRVVVKLTYMDDYTVEFWQIKAGRLTATALLREEKRGIYADELQSLIIDTLGIDVPVFTK